MAKNNHIMVDCETLSTARNPMLLSIGAVQFDPERGEILNTFYAPIALNGYSPEEEKEFDISISTLLFWLNQESPAIKEAFFSGDRIPLKAALESLQEFVHERSHHGAPVLWSCDETADLVWLEEAYQICGIPCPWGFRGHRCFRTIREIAYRLGIDHEAKKYAEKYGDTKHHALEDAMRQARFTLAVFNHLDYLKGAS